MARTADSFQRRSAKYKPQPRVLVICEDTKSSKIYFEEASRHYRAHAKVQFSHSGKTDPLGIVTAAIQQAQNFDHIYCVIDRDSHNQKNFEAAQSIGQSNQSKITVLTSYPCFEFWLLLHFGYTRSPFVPSGGKSAADNVLNELKTKHEMSSYAKGNVAGLFNKLLPTLSGAQTNALRTLRDSASDGEMNPSTPLHELIAKLEELGKLKPI